MMQKGAPGAITFGDPTWNLLPKDEKEFEEMKIQLVRNEKVEMKGKGLVQIYSYTPREEAGLEPPQAIAEKNLTITKNLSSATSATKLSMNAKPSMTMSEWDR